MILRTSKWINKHNNPESLFDSDRKKQSRGLAAWRNAIDNVKLIDIA